MSSRNGSRSGTRLGEPFDPVYAATAWHWIDAAVRCQRAAAALRADGLLALWEAGHVVPYDGDPFFKEIQEVYEKIGEGMPAGSALPRPQELADSLPRSRRAVCSRWSTSPNTTGRRPAGADSRRRDHRTPVSSCAGSARARARRSRFGRPPLRESSIGGTERRRRTRGQGPHVRAVRHRPRSPLPRRCCRRRT